MTSEFGKGFIYPLILFAKHYERVVSREKIAKNLGFNEYNDFFYTATDHLYEIEIPEQFKKMKIAKLTKQLTELCFKYRLPLDNEKEPTKKEFDKAIDLLEQIAFEIDKKLGLKPKKAEWK